MDKRSCPRVASGRRIHWDEEMCHQRTWISSKSLEFTIPINNRRWWSLQPPHPTGRPATSSMRVPSTRCPSSSTSPRCPCPSPPPAPGPRVPAASFRLKARRAWMAFQNSSVWESRRTLALVSASQGESVDKGTPSSPRTWVQPDGPASNILRPGDKILKANGHSFLHMEHETAVSLLKNFPKTVDLVILRESTI